MAVFFTSDLHLGHRSILSIRPMFSDINEHDAFLIQRWNKKVTNKDDVYILGDLSFRAEKPVSLYLSQLKGRKHLIVGNHDGHWMKQVQDMSVYFESVDYLKIIRHEKKQITLCHYPMLEWPGSRYVESGTSFLIHGHIHNETRSGVYDYISKNQPHAFNAGVDINGFEPVSFEELKENNRRWYDQTAGVDAENATKPVVPNDMHL